MLYNRRRDVVFLFDFPFRDEIRFCRLDYSRIWTLEAIYDCFGAYI